MNVIAPDLRRTPVLRPCLACIGWLALLACAACPGSVPDPDAFLGQGDDAGTTDAPAAAACPDVPTMFSTACGGSGCHDATTKAEGLDLASPDVAARLVGVPAVEGRGFLIDTANAASSVVYTKLLPTPPFGLRMPTTVALDDATIQCVLAWVTNEAGSGQGAPGDGGGGVPSGDDGGGTMPDAGTPPPFAPIRVAAGQASAVKDASGNTWSADADYTGGTAAVESSPVAIAKTDTPALYNGQRYGNPSFSYQVTVPNGSYAVTLKFAELYVTGPGMREFDIVINGSTVEKNFDIYSAAGGMNTAVDRTYPVTVTNGTLEMDFDAGPIQFPKVDAIQITQGAGDAGM